MEGYACLKCGLVWSSTSPDKLVEFIQKYRRNDESHIRV